MKDFYRLNIKPLSINKAFRGRKFKTKEHSAYEEELLWILPDLNIPKGIKLKLTVIYGINKMADLDNNQKIFQDALSKKWGFNDKLIYELIQIKIDAKKGEEFIEFKIEESKGISDSKQAKLYLAGRI